MNYGARLHELAVRLISPERLTRLNVWLQGVHKY